MSEGAIGLVVFLTTGVVAAVAWHVLVRRFWVASLGATVTTFVVCHLLVAIFPGTPTKFYAIAVIFSAIYAAAISVGVGVPIWWIRRKREAHAP